ncbi:uncharacterized protein LOC129920976 [Episyrphus balteatus]|uniref:uncharacterized protein LOC129920976 n=1 Tax=Episyrphus balteatus TaxID=286459 RepID=UPI00248541CA|nr:uncharacterized protein LOC129920976 [Episyrphus balteatus]
MKQLEKLEKQLLFLSDKIGNITSPSQLQTENTLNCSINITPVSQSRTETQQDNLTSYQKIVNNTQSCNSENQDKTSPEKIVAAPLKRKSDTLDQESSSLIPSLKKLATSVSAHLETPTFSKSQQIVDASNAITPPPKPRSPIDASALTGNLDCGISLVKNNSTGPLPHLNVISSTLPNQNIPMTNQTKFVSPIESGLKIVEGQKTIFISKLDPKTNALDIKNYIQNKLGMIRFMTVEKMIQRNFSKYSSFKIKVPDSIFYILNSSSFWPNGIIMHEFENRSAKTQHTNFRPHLTMRNPRRSSFNNY